MSTEENDGIQITPTDQRRATELLEAGILGDGELIDDLMAVAEAAGIKRCLALVGVMTRWSSIALVERHGRDVALRLIEGAKFDAALAEVPPEDDDDGVTTEQCLE